MSEKNNNQSNVPKLLGQGAEATIKEHEGKAVKHRPVKNYRHPELDARLRKQRHQTEVSIIRFLTQKGVAVPKIISDNKDQCSYDMELVVGKQLRDVLITTNARTFGEKCGILLGQLHSLQVSHGDVTTSNILVNEEEKVILIDFGLATRNARVEDMAVDLHVLEQTLDGHHATCKKEFLQGFFSKYTCDEIKERLDVVNKRGKNKNKTSSKEGS